MKTCFRCKATLPLTGFYVHPQMGDGHLGKCKECTKADTARREAQLYANPVTRAKERARHRDKQARYRAEGRATPATPESRARWTQAHPERRAAQLMVGNAIKSGRLVRQPCEVCGETKVDGHHPDYTQPLNVRWLCRKHHMELHRKDHAEV